MLLNPKEETEYLDYACNQMFGHTDWEFHKDTDLNKFVIIFNIKEEE